MDDITKKTASKYDYIRLSLIDFHGVLRCKTFPKERFDKVFQHGSGMFIGILGTGLGGELEAVPEYMLEKIPNVTCKPDPTTVHPLPLHGDSDARMGQVFGDTFYITNGKPQVENPRYILHQQLDKLEDLGYLLKSSWEIEYMVFDAEKMKTKFTKPAYALSTLGSDLYNQDFIQLHKALKAMGIEIESFSIEVAPGQCELALHPVVGMKQADNLCLIKDTLKYLHSRRGEKAVFMCKPFPGKFATNGFHLNHSLLCKATKRNVFYDSLKEDNFSDVWRHWLAGLLKHSRAITALACPTVNCYRRMHEVGTPSKANWGVDDRLSTYRAKNISQSETYIECRLPSGSCCSYLTMAAVVAAGIDGLVNAYDLPEPRSSPDETDTDLPHTLEEAIVALEEDSYMVEALGPSFVSWFCKMKRIESSSEVFKGFEPKRDDEDSYQREREYYMDVL